MILLSKGKHRDCLVHGITHICFGTIAEQPRSADRKVASRLDGTVNRMLAPFLPPSPPNFTDSSSAGILWLSATRLM